MQAFREYLESAPVRLNEVLFGHFVEACTGHRCYTEKDVWDCQEPLQAYLNCLELVLREQGAPLQSLESLKSAKWTHFASFGKG